MKIFNIILILFVAFLLDFEILSYKIGQREIAELTSKVSVYLSAKKQKSITKSINDIKLTMANVLIINWTLGAQASGTHIRIANKDYILTVAHLFSKNPSKDKISIIINDLKRREMLEKTELVVFDRKSDLALIRINQKWDYPYLTVAKEEPKKNDSVWIVGNPDGLQDVIVFGRIAGIKKDIYATTAHIYHGHSGGAVINKNNELIGVVSGAFVDQWHYPAEEKSVIFSLVVSLRKIREFLGGI